MKLSSRPSTSDLRAIIMSLILPLYKSKFSAAIFVLETLSTDKLFRPTVMFVDFSLSMV
jgi:hypothetical protein